MEENGALSTGGGSRPIPDPTVLTAALVDKATSALREILEARISGDREVITTRLAGMDEAIKLLQTILDRRSGETDVKIGHLQALHEEKFRGLEVRILERDDNVTQAKADAKVGIDAALASAEKLVGQSNDSFKELFEKAERSTEKLLDKQDENQKNSAGALEDKIAGLKERLDRIEGAAVAVVSQRADTVATTTMDRGSNSFLLAVFVAGISLLGLIALLIRDFAR